MSAKTSWEQLFPTVRKTIDKFVDLPKSRSLWIALAVFYALSTLVLLTQWIDYDLATAYGLAVPDVVNMANSIQELWEHGKFWAPETGLQGIVFLYGWAWLYHTSLCFLINAVLVLLSAVLAHELFVKNMGAPAWSMMGLLANPYLILVMPGPNKEIPLILLTLLLATALLKTKPNWLLASAICLPMYFLRDGYGLLMLAMVFMARILKDKERTLPISVLVVAMIATSCWPYLAPQIPALARNLNLYKDLFESTDSAGSIISQLNIDPFGLLGGLLMYVRRLIYNLVSLAFFPVFKTAHGHIYWLGIAYWIYGLTALTASIGCMWRWLLPHKDSRDLAASLALSAWLMISLSQFIQPRYFMPFLTIAFCVMAGLPRFLRLWSLIPALCLSIIVMAFTNLTGRSPPPAPVEISPIPAYLL